MSAHMPLQSAAAIPQEVRKRAAEWLVELQADTVTDDTRKQWQRWRDAHPDHLRAWQKIEAFGEKLQTLSSPLAHAALTTPGSAGRRQAIKTLAIMLFAGGTTWLVEEQLPWRQWSADRRTGVGERATITLADGTLLELNAETSVDIHYSDTQRIVRLLSGDIMITTAHDPRQASGGKARPFLVETRQGSIRALGTQFSVQQRNEQRGGASKVSVFEGAVEIRPNLKGEARILQAGQQTSFTADGFSAIEAVDEAVTAWRQGMIVAQDLPLRDFLKELGNYRPGHIDCDDKIAQLPVTGTYPLKDTDKVLDMLQTTLPLQVRFVTRYWVTLHAV
nr:FecR domain-containing protein [Janthinobacterium sp. Marseille]